jgi:hypothetical protein
LPDRECPESSVGLGRKNSTIRNAVAGSVSEARKQMPKRRLAHASVSAMTQMSRGFSERAST